jgi:hypothetical protein
MSRVPWNFGDGPMIIRLRSRLIMTVGTDSALGDMPFEGGP